MTGRGRILTLLILAAVAGGAWYWYEHRSAEAPGQGALDPGNRRRAFSADGPVPVLAATVETADVPVYLEGVGTVQAYNSVVVKSQVDGQLVKVAFKEGQEVARGDLLAQIDPRTYKAAYDEAVAKKAQDLANLANARIDLTRYRNLAQNQYGSKQQADTQAAEVAQLEAQVQSDQAAIDSAGTSLDYTTITAPIDGRTGIRTVDEGNIVHASDTDGIVTITQLRPISILFTLPQQSFGAVMKAGDPAQVEAAALAADNRTALEIGHLEVIDNQIDTTTGTFKLKATFPNADYALWPGQFTNVRLRVATLKGAMVVPVAAVQQGANGALTYVIGTDGKVKATDVKVTRQDETRAVIASGLKPGDRVVTSGFARLSDGAEVRISAAEAPGEGDGTAQPGGPSAP